MSMTNQPQFLTESNYAVRHDERWMHALIATCINVAINDALTALQHKTKKTYILGRNPQSSAITWIFNPPSKPAFNSFESFCDILEIDPARARKKIYEMLVDKFGNQVAELGIVING